MVNIAREPTGGKGHKEEYFDHRSWTAQNTGGDPTRRRMQADYRKVNPVPGGTHEIPGMSPEYLIRVGQKPV
jgi:hypothetical protein